MENEGKGTVISAVRRAELEYSKLHINLQLLFQAPPQLRERLHHQVCPSGQESLSAKGCCDSHRELPCGFSRANTRNRILDDPALLGRQRQISLGHLEDLRIGLRALEAISVDDRSKTIFELKHPQCRRAIARCRRSRQRQPEASRRPAYKLGRTRNGLELMLDLFIKVLLALRYEFCVRGAAVSREHFGHHGPIRPSLVAVIHRFGQDEANLSKGELFCSLVQRLGGYEHSVHIKD